MRGSEWGLEKWVPIERTLNDHSYYLYQSIPVLLYCMRGSGCGFEGGGSGVICNLQGHLLNIYTPFLIQYGNQGNNKRVLM